MDQPPNETRLVGHHREQPVFKKERKEASQTLKNETRMWKPLGWSDKEGMYINEDYLHLIYIKCTLKLHTNYL